MSRGARLFHLCLARTASLSLSAIDASHHVKIASMKSARSVQSIGFGNIGTPTEANARLISSLPLSPDFLGVIGEAPRLNGGAEFLGVNPAYLRSERGRNELRSLFNLPLRRPDFEPTKEFNAEEPTYAAYVEGAYEIALGALTLDGVQVSRMAMLPAGVVFVAGPSTVPLALHPSATAFAGAGAER